jgi:formylmethanofuran dehydrogenase subunit E
MKEEIPNAYMEQLEANLEGTAQSLHEAMGLECPYNYDDVQVEIGSRGNIELCDNCGWWCSMSEMKEKNGETLCNDCQNETD